jgi:hypothetical protein
VAQNLAHRRRFRLRAPQRVLRLDCPRCGTPKLNPNRIIQQSADFTLHPTQCRRRIRIAEGATTRCGTHLESVPIDSPPPSRDILALQRHIRCVLDGAGSDREAAQYFTDLKLITALITTALPHCQHLIAPEFVDPVANHERLNPGRGRQTRYLHTVLDKPVIDPLAAAGLLQAAHALLACGDLQAAPTPLIDPTFTPIAAKIAWSRFFHRHRARSSGRLRQALIDHPMLNGAN